MKKLSIKVLAASLSLALFAATGCLKDDDYDKGINQSVHATDGEIKVVEIGLTTTSTTNFLIASFNSSPDDTVVDLIPVNLATKDPAPEDIHVTLVPKQSLVDDYNTTNGTEYEDPAALYELQNGGVVTIPKGSRTGYLQIKFKPSEFISGSWAVGFQISSIQEAGYVVSGNLSNGIVAIGIKNAYDGVYHAVGHFDHPSLGGDYDAEWTLTTTGAQSNSFQLITTAIFSVIVDLTVDPVTNLVTVESASVNIDPYVAANNYYDPATRTFHLDFGYTTSAPRHVTGTAEYEHP